MMGESTYAAQKRTVIFAVLTSVSLSLAIGLLIGYYAINGGCELKQKTEVEPPIWPFVAHTWDLYADKHVVRTAWKSLMEDDRSHLEAVVDALTDAEMDDDVWNVASGNKPDDQGETTLDAMVMDGETHDVGAVGGLRGVKNAIAAAYAVMKYTSHTLLVGNMASDFAISMGVPKVNITIQPEIDRYDRWRNEDNCQPNFRKNVLPDPSSSCGPYTAAPGTENQGTPLEISAKDHDTIGIVVIAPNGKMAVGTSTNGLRHKVHGRVGDSPIPGAGSYVDKDIGACTATGNGDVMIRFLPCLQAIEDMRHGMTAREAAKNAMDKIDQYYDNYDGAILVVYRDGTYGGACSGYTSFTFVYQHAGMDEPAGVEWFCEQ